MSETQTIHLSPLGNDANDGTFAQPVATPRRAQELARAATSGVLVSVHDGVYELDETLLFTPADSGQRWSAAPGARPTFSGGRRLKGWAVESHEGKTVWTLDLPSVREGGWWFTQLWVNGSRRNRPRLPKTGFFRFAGLDGQPDSGMNWMTGPTRAEYSEGTLERFRNLDDVRIISYQLWFDTHHGIKELDEERRVVHFHTKSLGSLVDESGQFARYFLMNVGEALTEPGEWYLDRSRGVLAYLPLPDETPERVKVVAPRLTELVRFQGDETTAVTDVILENLTLAHNEWIRPDSACGTIQAAFDVPGAVMFDRAERCVLYGCEVAHIAGYGVEMFAGCHANVIAACIIRDLGAGAVKVGHEELRVHTAAVGDDFTTEPRWLRPMATTIADCHLHDGGHIYPSAVGVWIGNAGQNRVQFNNIHHFAYTGVSCGWTWSYEPTRTWDNRIEYNHIHHINQQRVLSDNGAIYTLGIQPGTKVIGNHIHDISCYHYGGQGLYPDEGSSGIEYSNNCVHHVFRFGYGFHFGCYLTVKNNIFAVMGEGILEPGRTDISCGHVMEGNIMTWTDCDSIRSSSDWEPQVCTTKNNLVWKDGVGGVPWFRETLANEQAAGRWEGTVEADPLFADVRSGDFTLRSDSPAFAIGFQPFDWRVAGVRTRDVLPQNWSEYRLPDAPLKPIALARIVAGNLTISGDTAQLPLCVTLVNPSTETVDGRWKVCLGNGAVPRVEPGAELRAVLAPGESVQHELMVHLQAAHGRQWIQVLGDEEICFSAAVSATVPPAVTMPRLPEGADLATSDGLDLSIVHAGTQMLSGKAALIGDSIAVELQIHDTAMKIDHEGPWRGASAELFAAAEPTPGVLSIPQQWTLVPGDEHGSAAVHREQGSVDPQTWEIGTMEGGWWARIRLPLSALGLEPDAENFRFDVLCTAMSPISGQNLLRLPCWGVPNNWASSANLVRVLTT